MNTTDNQPAQARSGVTNDPYIYCHHGKKYVGEDCPDCDRLWNEECLERAYQSVVHYSNKLSIPFPEIARTFKRTQQ